MPQVWGEDREIVRAGKEGLLRVRGRDGTALPQTRLPSLHKVR